MNVPMGGRHNLPLEIQGLSRSQGLKSAGLDDPQQLDLDQGVKLPDFV
jgi:hypothetical protein